jgi:hypothetical protein
MNCTSASRGRRRFQEELARFHDGQAERVAVGRSSLEERWVERNDWVKACRNLEQELKWILSGAHVKD